MFVLCEYSIFMYVALLSYKLSLYRQFLIVSVKRVLLSIGVAEPYYTS